MSGLNALEISVIFPDTGDKYAYSSNIPIMRWKRGERAALGSLSPGCRSAIRPLFSIENSTYIPRTPAARRVPLSPADIFATEVHTRWGTSPFLLDASALAAGGNHPIIDIANSARGRGLHIIPATSLSANQAYLGAIGGLHLVDGQGVALRVDLSQFVTAASWIGSWPFSMACTDLIVDLGDGAPNTAALGAALLPAFRTLHGAGQWRSVTVAGTSIPQNYTGYTAGMHRVSRTEIAIWSMIAGAGLPYAVDFGDYLTISPTSPPPGIRWGFPINVKYTLPNETLVCRGVSPTGLGAIQMAPQLSAHAASIFGYANRGALAHCFGDQRVDAIAGGAAPGNLENWVTISANRHIELTRTQIP